MRVRYGIYESNEEMLAKVMTGNSGLGRGLPHPQPHRAHAAVQPAGAASPRAGCATCDNLDARFRAPAWDPRLAWCVPYMWGATGIAYNRKVAPPPASWADLWSERLKGRMTMLDDPEDVLGACLKKLGLPLQRHRPGGTAPRASARRWRRSRCCART